MARRAAIERFTRDALSAGHDRASVRAALSNAGWDGTEINRALAAFADTDFSPPVPRPQNFVTARDGFIYGLTFVALLVIVTNAVGVAFELTEWVLRGARLRLNWDVAALIVFVPVFVTLDRRVRGAERQSPMRKTFAYFALFIAALVLLGALVAIIALVLSGGLGLEIALKSLTVAVTAGLVALYYRKDLVEDSVEEA